MSYLRIGFLLVSLAALAGCGGTGQLPVSGTVTLDDKPVGDGSDAIIRFEPDSPGGNSGESFLTQGKYSTKLIPGKYKVSISWTKPTGKKLKTKVDGPGNDSPELEQLIPAQYNTATKLSAEISADKQQHDFKLTSSKK